MKPTVKELLEATRSNEVDLAIAAISITAEREIDWDFSQPMFDAGLQILTPAQGTQGGLVAAIIAGVFSPAVLPILGLVLLMILIPAHLVWFFERKNSTGMLTHRSYFPGIFEACWWAASTLATQADQMPRAALARIVAVIWMFASVVFIAYFTAAVTSSLTLQQLRGDINGPEDLPGKRVATVKGSTSMDYLRSHNIEAMEFANVEEALRAHTARLGGCRRVRRAGLALLRISRREGQGAGRRQYFSQRELRNPLPIQQPLSETSQ